METKTKILTVIIDEQDLQTIDEEFVDITYRNMARTIGEAILEQNGAYFAIQDNIIEAEDDRYTINGKKIGIKFEYVITDPKKVLKEDMMELIKE